MKFKQIVLFGICAFRFCSWEVQAMTPETVPIRYNINEMDNLPTGYEEIILMGDLMMGNGPRPIIAGANDNSIYIHFNQSFGNVNILIYNAMGGLIYNMEDTLWHFPDLDYADSICDVYFSDNVNYKWNSLGETELQRALNCYESYDWVYPTPYLNQNRRYYIFTRYADFIFCPQHYTDPFGSPNSWNSRLFAVPGNPEYNIPKSEMCYYFDSYLGLGYQYIVEHPNGDNEYPVQWVVTHDEQVFNQQYYCSFYHNLKVIYGKCNVAQNQINY